MSKKYLYGLADIHLLPQAKRGVSIPLSFPLCTPVEFRGHSGELWSLWIVPEEPLYVCRWSKAKIAVAVQEHASRLLIKGAYFDIWFGGEVGGEGIVREVRECDAEFYWRTFRFSD